MTISNEFARALRSQLRSFLNHVTTRMQSERPDKKDTATKAYVATRKLLREIERGLHDTK